MFNRLNLHHHLFLFTVIFLLWLLLTGSVALDELIVGFFVAVVVSLISAPYITVFEGIRYRPTALISVFTYLVYFRSEERRVGKEC